MPFAAAPIDPRGLSSAALAEALWLSHDLSWKLDEHQLSAYTALREWEKRPIQMPKAGEKIGLARWWVDDWGRRVGKTFKNGVVLLENGLRREDSRMIYATR